MTKGIQFQLHSHSNQDYGVLKRVLPIDKCNKIGSRNKFI